MDKQLKTAMQRCEAISNGATINGLYKQKPIAAIEEFKLDLKLLVEYVKDHAR